MTDLLKAPSNQNLSGSLVELLDQRLEVSFIKSLASHDWAICFTDNASFSAPLHNIRPGQPRMKLPLANADFSTFALTILGLKLFDIGLKLIEMMDPVVGNT